jgi:N-acetylmuramic acid 6-phosphate (MurNAc-6-P) etherase
MISTMIQLGESKGNKMVDMQLSNSKLVIVAQNDYGRNFVMTKQQRY